MSGTGIMAVMGPYAPLGGQDTIDNSAVFIPFDSLAPVLTAPNVNDDFSSLLSDLTVVHPTVQTKPTNILDLLGQTPNPNIIAPLNTTPYQYDPNGVAQPLPAATDSNLWLYLMLGGGALLLLVLLMGSRK